MHRLLAVLGLLPRGGLRYEALWPPSCTPLADGAEGEESATTERSDSSDPYFKITGGPPGDGLGAVLEQYAVRASSRVEDGQDGGAVTALLLALLAAGEINGALVSKPSSDPDEPWKGVATVATTPEEILTRPAASTTRRWPWARSTSPSTTLGPKPRLAVVGTPCEIQGIRAMQARRWATGAHRIDAVVLTIALMCTKSFDYEGLILRELRQRRRVDLDRVEQGRRDPRAA